MIIVCVRVLYPWFRPSALSVYHLVPVCRLNVCPFMLLYYQYFCSIITHTVLWLVLSVPVILAFACDLLMRRYPCAFRLLVTLRLLACSWCFLSQTLMLSESFSPFNSALVLIFICSLRDPDPSWLNVISILVPSRIGTYPRLIVMSVLPFVFYPSTLTCDVSPSVYRSIEISSDTTLTLLFFD